MAMKWYKKQMDKLKKTQSTEPQEKSASPKIAKQILAPKMPKGSNKRVPSRMEKRSRPKTDLP